MRIRRASSSTLLWLFILLINKGEINMILDKVLKENAVMESLTEAQKEYVVDAYAARYCRT